MSMSSAERQQRYRDRQRASRPQPPPDLLALDAEAIAQKIMANVPPEKADKIAQALNRHLVLWRVGTFNPQHPHVTGGAGPR
jgi:hypothetical protein